MAMREKACCTCATLLSAKNPRFLSYCPYCQTSGRSAAASRRRATRPEEKPDPAAATVDPPPYHTSLSIPANPTPTTASEPPDASYPPPPPYSALPPPWQPPAGQTQQQQQQQQQQKQQQQRPQQGDEEYIVHHLRHSDPADTLPSLSLRYGVPVAVLRRHNRLPQGADHLLAARHTLLIPASQCSRPNPTSLSPHPPESPEERARKTTIRRWMVACKEADYDVALVYLEEAGYDLDEAVGRYVEDEAWEREHALDKHKQNYKFKRVGGGKQKGVVRRTWTWGWG